MEALILFLDKICPKKAAYNAANASASRGTSKLHNHVKKYKLIACGVVGFVD